MGVVLRRKERREDLVDGREEEEEEEEMVVVNGGVEIGLVEEEAMAILCFHFFLPGFFVIFLGNCCYG